MTHDEDRSQPAPTYSNLPNAQTTSPPAAMIKLDRSLLWINALIDNAAIQSQSDPCTRTILRHGSRRSLSTFCVRWRSARGCFPAWRNAPDASIINLSGGGATGPRMNFSAYASAKAALVRFSQNSRGGSEGSGNNSRLHRAWGHQNGHASASHRKRSGDLGRSGILHRR